MGGGGGGGGGRVSHKRPHTEELETFLGVSRFGLAVGR